MIVEAVTKAGWEMMGHSYEQMPMHAEVEPEKMIVRTLDILEKHTGQRPIGWLSPGFGETFDTPDHLAAAGVKYIAEWPYDDEPTRIATKHGPLVTLPYPIECQDVTTLAVQTQEAQYFARKCIDAFERLYEESARRPKFFSIAVHPYAAGQPHAIRHLEAIYEHTQGVPREVLSVCAIAYEMGRLAGLDIIPPEAVPLATTEARLP